MHSPSERELLQLWERGEARHPIDRALLLCSAARPDLTVETLVGLPLGRINAQLLRLRAALFGDSLLLQARCEACNEALELPLMVGELLGQVAELEVAGAISCQGFWFRQPTSRDLAGVAGHDDAEAAAVQLLESCWIDKPDGEKLTKTLLSAVDALLEQGDPLADPQLVVSCPACDRQMTVTFDPGQLLWEEVGEQVRQFMFQVHVLAKAYGWTESDILALSPRRRRKYLQLAEGG
jgi:hypothetical protein